MQTTTPMAQEMRRGFSVPTPLGSPNPAVVPRELRLLRPAPPDFPAPLPMPSHAPRGLSYQEIAAQPLGKVKLWLGYSLIYPGLCYFPEPMQRKGVRVLRSWLHGEQDESADLRALLEHGIARDDLLT